MIINKEFVVLSVSGWAFWNLKHRVKHRTFCLTMGCSSDVLKKTSPLDVFGDVSEKVKHLTNGASNDVSPPALHPTDLLDVYMLRIPFKTVRFWLWHQLKALLTVGCLEVLLKILWAEPDISQRLCSPQLWTTFQKCTSVVQNKVKHRNHIKHIVDPYSLILLVSNQK